MNRDALLALRAHVENNTPGLQPPHPASIKAGVVTESQERLRHHRIDVYTGTLALVAQRVLDGLAIDTAFVPLRALVPPNGPGPHGGTDYAYRFLLQPDVAVAFPGLTADLLDAVLDAADAADRAAVPGVNWGDASVASKVGALPNGVREDVMLVYLGAIAA